MAGTKTVNLSFEATLDVAGAIKKIATQYDISMAKTILKLLQLGIDHVGEVTEVAEGMPLGAMHKNGVAKRVSPLRKML